MPPTTNIEASRGRAASRTSVIRSSYTTRRTPVVARWGGGGRRRLGRRSHVRSLRLQPPARGPHRGVRGRRQPGPRGAEPRLQRGPHQGGVRRRRAAAFQGRGGEGRSGRAPAAHADLGPHPVVGEGPQDRQPDDQRADGDGRGEAVVPPGVLLAALPAAGRRLLRVVRHLGARQVRQAAQAAVLHPAQGPRRAGDGRALRDLARPRQGRGRPRPVPLDVHRDHDGRGGRRRATSTTGCR